jgi:hypothetical protein
MTSKVPAEWGNDSWIMLNQRWAVEMASNDEVALWLRVVHAAYGRLSANGHATFKQRELQGILGHRAEGVWHPADRRSVTRAISIAVEKGLLLAESRALCLVAPPQAVAMGAGNADAPCKRHTQKAPRAALRVVS